MTIKRYKLKPSSQRIPNLPEYFFSLLSVLFGVRKNQFYHFVTSKTHSVWPDAIGGNWSSHLTALLQQWCVPFLGCIMTLCTCMRVRPQRLTQPCGFETLTHFQSLWALRNANIHTHIHTPQPHFAANTFMCARGYVMWCLSHHSACWLAGCWNVSAAVHNVCVLLLPKCFVSPSLCLQITLTNDLMDWYFTCTTSLHLPNVSCTLVGHICCALSGLDILCDGSLNVTKDCWNATFMLFDSS